MAIPAHDLRIARGLERSAAAERHAEIGLEQMTRRVGGPLSGLTRPLRRPAGAQAGASAPQVFDAKLTATYPTREYCVQHDETAFDFISRLMEEEGIFYFFEHGDDGKLCAPHCASCRRQPPGGGGDFDRLGDCVCARWSGNRHRRARVFAHRYLAAGRADGDIGRAGDVVMVLVARAI